MRIIAGEFGGRRLKPPAGRRIRPTADRVREAWFSILGPELRGATVLDLFAGSGALGLEALSRGARRVTFVESAPRSLAALRANIATLGVEDRCTVHRGDVWRFVRRLGDAAVFDVVLADPPYSTDFAARLVQHFRERPLARILVVEHRAATPIEGDDTRRYGDIALTFCHAP